MRFVGSPLSSGLPERIAHGRARPEAGRHFTADGQSRLPPPGSKPVSKQAIQPAKHPSLAPPLGHCMSRSIGGISGNA
jgi:hypothetical protein